MAYEPQLEPDEKLICQWFLQVGKKTEPFHFAASDRALYWPRKKLIALKDPYYFQRIPHSQIQQVSVKRLSPYLLWILAGIMILAGLFTSILMMEPILKHEPGAHRVSGWPFAVFVGGVLLPFAARGRFGLHISTSDRNLKWSPPLVVDGGSKEKIAKTLTGIANVCQKAGLRVADMRPPHP